MATFLNVSSHHHVLDPFAGAGTTLIECQAAQIRATGIELNPLLQYVTNASLDWTVDAAAAKAAYLTFSHDTMNCTPAPRSTFSLLVQCLKHLPPKSRIASVGGEMTS